MWYNRNNPKCIIFGSTSADRWFKTDRPDADALPRTILSDVEGDPCSVKGVEGPVNPREAQNDAVGFPHRFSTGRFQLRHRPDQIPAVATRDEKQHPIRKHKQTPELLMHRCTTTSDFCFFYECLGSSQTYRVLKSNPSSQTGVKSDVNQNNRLTDNDCITLTFLLYFKFTVTFHVLYF